MTYPDINELENFFHRIKLVVFDFDGVFTDNIVYTNFGRLACFIIKLDLSVSAIWGGLF